MKADPGKIKDCDWQYVEAVEQKVGEIVAENFGFKSKPIILKTLGKTPEYDLMFDFGNGDVVRVEVKLSRDTKLPVEFCSNGKGTGISGTTADLWVFLNVGGTRHDKRGVDLGNGWKVEGKFNVIKPDTILQFILENVQNEYSVRHESFDGVEVAYVNPFELHDKHWFGTCEVTTVPDMNNPEMLVVKGFDLNTFTPAPRFDLSRVIRHKDKLGSDEMNEIAYNSSTRLLKAATGEIR